MKIKFRLFKRKSTADPTKCVVTFPVLHETHSLADFQKQGHFVAAIRERDAQGNSTNKPRQWQGSTVHAVSLLDGNGAIHQTPNAKGEMRSTFRVLSDSHEDAERMFADAIRDGLYAQLRSLQIAGFSADQARKVKDERDRMAAWMAHFHPQVLGEILGVGEAAVEAYKRSQNDPAMKADVEAKLNGGM